MLQTSYGSLSRAVSAKSWDSFVGSQEARTRKLCPGQGQDWPYLGLGESELRCQLSSLGQGQVLGMLETLVQVLQLQAGVDGSRLAKLPGQGLLGGLERQCQLL